MIPVNRIESLCSSWLGTPYRHGQRRRGAGVDCANFIVAVLDELYGVQLPPIPTFPAGAGATSEKAEPAIRAIMSRFPHERVNPSEPIEPGDVVFTLTGDHVGHVLLAGVRAGELWHAARGVGVCRTGLGAYAGQIDRLYRPLNKELW